MTYRVGRHFPIHVYEGDRPVATFHDPDEAARFVAAINQRRQTMKPDTATITLTDVDVGVLYERVGKAERVRDEARAEVKELRQELADMLQRVAKARAENEHLRDNPPMVAGAMQILISDAEELVKSAPKGAVRTRVRYLARTARDDARGKEWARYLSPNETERAEKAESERDELSERLVTAEADRDAAEGLARLLRNAEVEREEVRDRADLMSEVGRLRAGIEGLTRTGYSHTPDCEHERDLARLTWHPDCGRCCEDALLALLNPTEGEGNE